MAENAADMMRMQQEAIRRVRLMQERANRSVTPTADAGNSPTASEKAPAAPKRKYKRAKKNSPAVSAFARMLAGDSEQMLLLVLLLILMDEKTDPSLIFALLYLILP